MQLNTLPRKETDRNNQTYNFPSHHYFDNLSKYIYCISIKMPTINNGLLHLF